MILFKENGIRLIFNYIKELEAKRKEILDAGLDSASDTELPTIDDIKADIELTGLDSDGLYCNSWGVTDNYNADYPLVLRQDEDFIETPLPELNTEEK